MKKKPYLFLCQGMFLLLLFSAVLPVSAADIFMNVAGIEGESTSKGHEKEIMVDSWKLELSNTVIREGGGGARAGKVKFNDIQITKKIDKSTPLLMLAASSGQHIPQVVLKISKRSGNTASDYLVITLKDVLISSINVSGDNNNDQMNEELTINFSEIQFAYTPQKPDGTLDQPIRYGWDLFQNKKI
mgnify:CR=1 FL=1